MADGTYRVSYTATLAGSYQLSVQTASGMDIYCGLGVANKCSPFSLTVAPGVAVGSMSEAQSDLTAVVDSLANAVAGQTGYFKVQAKDAYGNNLLQGGDDVAVNVFLASAPTQSYHAAVQDLGAGLYSVIYTIPIVGTYTIAVTINSDPVQLCVTPVLDILGSSRTYNGLNTYSGAAANCVLAPTGTLTVVHGDLHEQSSTASGSGLQSAVVGVPQTFSVQSNDAFGNRRTGAGSGDGMSDAFLVKLTGGSSGYEVLTSTAQVLLTLPVSPTAGGTFALGFGGASTVALPYTASAAAIQHSFWQASPQL